MPKVQWTSDIKKVLRDNARLRADIEKLKAQMRTVGTASTTTGKKMSAAGKAGREAFTPGHLKRFVGGLLGVGGVLAALRAISEEYRTHIELQKEAAQTQTTLAGARRDLAFNLAGAPLALGQEVTRFAGKIAARTNVGEIFITQGLTSAISASSASQQDVRTAMRAVELSATMAPHRPEQLGTFAGALVDMAKVTGTTDAMINLGFLRAVGSSSRVVDLEAQAANLPRALIGVRGAGATAGEAGAFVSALTTAMGDKQGRLGGQAAMVFAGQLKAFFEADVSEPIGERMATLITAKKELRARGRKGLEGVPDDLGDLPPSFSERIAFLRENHEIAEVFRQTANFGRQVAKAPLIDFITKPQSEMVRQFQQNMAERFGGPVGQFSGQAQDFLENVTALVGAPERAAAAGRIVNLLKEELELADKVGGVAGAMRENLGAGLKQSGLSRIGAGVSLIGFDLATAIGEKPPELIAAGILRARMSEVLRQDPRSRQQSEQQMRAAEALLHAAEKLEALVNSSSATTAELPGEVRSGGLGIEFSDLPGFGLEPAVGVSAENAVVGMLAKIEANTRKSATKSPGGTLLRKTNDNEDASVAVE